MILNNGEFGGTPIIIGALVKKRHAASKDPLYKRVLDAGGYLPIPDSNGQSFFIGVNGDLGIYDAKTNSSGIIPGYVPGSNYSADDMQKLLDNTKLYSRDDGGGFFSRLGSDIKEAGSNIAGAVKGFKKGVLDNHDFWKAAAIFAAAAAGGQAALGSPGAAGTATAVGAPVIDGTGTGLAGLNAGTAAGSAGGGLAAASVPATSAEVALAGAPVYDAAGTLIAAPGQAVNLAGATSVAQGALPATGGSLLGSLWDLGGTALSSKYLPGLMTLGGGYLQGKAAKDAAETSANAQLEAARIAAEQARFTPVGVKTAFGQSQFGYDPSGRLISAGYELSPQLKAQQDALMAMSGGALEQYQAQSEAAKLYGQQAGMLGGLAGKYINYQPTYTQDALNAQYQKSIADTAGYGQAATSMLGLGQQYLGTSPQAQAAKYMAQQQALLAPQRETEYANLINQLQATGRLGLATGGTSTMAAANPELQAYYNALKQQDLALAAQADIGGQQYAAFGGTLADKAAALQHQQYQNQIAMMQPINQMSQNEMARTTYGVGLLGTSADLQNQMFQNQANAINPYMTALSGAGTLESLGQGAMNLGTALGQQVSTAGANMGGMLQQGGMDAAQTMQGANAWSPWGNILTGAGGMLSNYQGQNQYKFDPFTGRAL